MDDIEQFKRRRLTPEEVRPGLEALEQAVQHSEEILARRGGQLFSPSWKIINEMRDERTRQLVEAMGWSSDWEGIGGDEPSEDS